MDATLRAPSSILNTSTQFLRVSVAKTSDINEQFCPGEVGAERTDRPSVCLAFQLHRIWDLSTGANQQTRLQQLTQQEVPQSWGVILPVCK